MENAGTLQQKVLNAAVTFLGWREHSLSHGDSGAGALGDAHLHTHWQDSEALGALLSWYPARFLLQ